MMGDKTMGTKMKGEKIKRYKIKEYCNNKMMGDRAPRLFGDKMGGRQGFQGSHCWPMCSGTLCKTTFC